MQAAQADEAQEQGAPAVEVPGEFTTFDYDVLVIGAGAAGTEAAIAARNAGASVIVVDKRQFETCGNSGLHSSGRMSSSEFEIDGDCPQVQLEDACDVGYYVVDQEWGTAVVNAYHDDGVLMKSENYGNIHWRTRDGEPMIEPCYNKNRLWTGYKLFNHAYEALRVGAKPVEYCTVTSLLTDEAGTVVGATGVDFKTGEFYVFRAKSVILATGGMNQLWGAGDVVAHYSGGAYGLTGDGHVMAAKAGAEFKDLEFRSSELGSPIAPNPILGATVVGPWAPTPEHPWLDRNGDDIFADYNLDELSFRAQCYEVQKMVEEGRAGDNDGYFADVTYEPLRDWGGTYGAGLELFGFFADDWDAIPRQWESRGMDMNNIEQMMNYVYEYGGIVTDPATGSTGVDGLYAAGEMGMNCGAGYTVFRVFSSTMVSGKWSGTAAAERAAALETPAVDWSQVADEYKRVYGILYAEPAEPVRVPEVRHLVQDAAYLGCGMWRSDKKCQAAFAELDRIESDVLPNMYVADKSKVCNIDWFEALETVNMVTIARMDTLAAQTRTESRGCHLRNEYPEMDNDNWLKNVYITLDADGRPQAEVRDVVAGYVELPTGKVDLGGGILPE